MKKLAFQKAREQINLIALPYDESRDQLLKELGRANISLMLSWHEGFGANRVGGCGRRSTPYHKPGQRSRQLLKETLGEQIAGGYVRTVRVRGKEGGDDAVNFLPEDERDVRDAIIECAANLEDARETAVKLKKELKEKLVCT